MQPSPQYDQPGTLRHEMLTRGLEAYIDVDTLIAVLYAICVSMAVFLLGLYIALVLQKRIIERRRAREEAAFERFCAQLASGNASGADRVGKASVIPEESAHRRALSRALARLNRRGVGAQTTDGATREALVRHLKDDTRHSHWGRRMAALEALGRLEIPSLLPFFMEFADQEEDRRVYAAALASAARLCLTPEKLRDLGVMLMTKPSLSRSYNESILFLAFDALTRGRALQDSIVQFIASIPQGHPLLADAVGTAARCGVREALPLIERLAADPGMDVTLRLSCLRAIGRLQPDHPQLETALRDKTWEARAVAASHLRSTRTGAMEGLKNALRDRNFHVRRNAAEALIELGEPGKSALREALNSDDRFARDASKAALEKQEIVS